MTQNIIIQNQLFQFTAGITLAECEADLTMIDKMSDAMKGERFNRIRENKLYRETHNTWEQYCKEKWNLTSQRVGQLIQFAEISQLIKSETQVSVLPQSETQTHPLNQLPPEEKIAAWNKAIESANGQQPTPDQVRAANNPGPMQRKTTTEITIEIYCPECGEKRDELRYWYKHNIDENNTCRHCKKTNPNKNWLTELPATNPTPGPAAQWLEKQKYSFCGICQRTWQEGKENSMFNVIYFEHHVEKNTPRKTCPNCTEKKYYCYNCNHEQVLTEKAIIYKNEVQCSNCKHHSRSWLTTPGETRKHCKSCNSIWRKTPNLAHMTYTPDLAKIYQCTEEKDCPICEHKAKQKPQPKAITRPIRPEMEINYLKTISEHMEITITTIETVIADPGLKYELINRIYEKVMQDEESDLIAELADLW